MFHNLWIDLSANAGLCIFWIGEERHHAYWALCAVGVADSPSAVVMDGPFPNARMAGADFFKRGPELATWIPAFRGEQLPPVQEQWKESYGFNFKAAFDTLHPDGVKVDGVQTIHFMK
jgi:hypothetical protein